MLRRKTEPPRGILQTAIAAGGAYQYERYHPSPDLEAYVEHYWTVEWDLRGQSPQKVETLPHPAVHLTFEGGGESCIRGPGKAKFSRNLEGKGDVFAVKFTPGGFYPFAGVPVSRFSDRTVGLHEVFGDAGDALERAVVEESTDAARLAVIEAFLRGHQPAPDVNVGLMTELVF